MKKDDFAEFNTTKKRGTRAVVVAAVIALCLAGFLYARTLQKESNVVFLDTDSVELAENNNR